MAIKIWVDGFTRSDGVRVKGHYRHVSSRNTYGMKSDAKTIQGAVKFAAKKLTDAGTVKKGKIFQEAAMHTNFPSLSNRIFP